MNLERGRELLYKYGTPTVVSLAVFGLAGVADSYDHVSPIPTRGVERGVGAMALLGAAGGLWIVSQEEIERKRRDEREFQKELYLHPELYPFHVIHAALKAIQEGYECDQNERNDYGSFASGKIDRHIQQFKFARVSLQSIQKSFQKEGRNSWKEFDEKPEVVYIFSSDRRDVGKFLTRLSIDTTFLKSISVPDRSTAFHETTLPTRIEGISIRINTKDATLFQIYASFNAQAIQNGAREELIKV